MNTEINLKTLIVKEPLKLDCGKTINDFPIAYETYGSLNEKKDNAILVFHALTGDQFVTGLNPITNKEGWWSFAVGPGKAIDTNKYFVICSNVLGDAWVHLDLAIKTLILKKLMELIFQY
tara:strand:- start:395 stop:754 length:360 start_codon:yes stop_codon:yes gene_type:complete